MDFSRFRQRSVIYLGFFLVFSAVIALSYFRTFDNYELETLDIRFRLRPRIPVDKNIVVIEIGDDTIDKLGKWPISRRYHAALINALTEAGARAIIFDVFFSEKTDEKADRLLEEAIKKSGRVYLPYVFNIVGEKASGLPLADRLQERIVGSLERAAKGAGFINIIPDSDGKFRRILPLVKYAGSIRPHICLRAFMDYMGFARRDVYFKPRRFIRLGDRLKIPTDSDSAVIVNFPGRWTETFRHYSYIDIINSCISAKFPEGMGKRRPVVDLASLEGSVCFIGVTATATPDAHPSPFDPLYPGVGVNASFFNSLLTNKFIRRAAPVENAAILVLLCFITYFISSRARTLLSFFFVFLFMLFYAALAAFAFFVLGIWLDVFYPLAVIVFVYLGVTFYKYIGEAHKIEVIEKELSIAKKIQESFLPKESPKISGIDVSARMATARQVGGDLYDFVAAGEKRLGVMIGDVSGKGMPAALFMAKVVSLFKTYAKEESASRTILKLNKHLCLESGSGLFVTLSYLLFDTESGLLSYSSGGHLPLIAAKEGKPESARFMDLKEGIPLGLFDSGFGEEKIRFEKGDIFVLYTDGVTEAMNPKGEMFGEERLINLVRKNTDLHSGGITDIIQSEVRAFEGKKKQHDDITVVVVKIV